MPDVSKTPETPTAPETLETPSPCQAGWPLTVALLCGGISNERAVSLKSAEGVRLGLEASGHRVKKIDTGNPRFIEELLGCNADVAFIALHGKGGEDGSIQGLLELAGIPYTGSGVMASALAMDKMRSKLLFEAAGLMTPAAAVLTVSDLSLFSGVSDFSDTNSGCEHLKTPASPTAPSAFSVESFTAPTALSAESFSAPSAERFSEELIDALIKEIGLPCVIKPSKDGSSVGVSIVRSRENLRQALSKGFAVSDELLVETFIKGTEVTVPIIGNEKPAALPIIEIIPVNEFYDYESKYSQGGSTHIIPARLSPEQLRACEEAACAAHEIIGCRGMSRVDMIVSAEGIPWIIEINTIPGMTSTSLVPDAARAANISMAELCDRLLMWALENRPLGACVPNS